MPIRTQLLKKWVGPDREKHMGSTPLYIWLWFGCDLLVAGSAFSACHQPAQYGVLLWTAGTYSPATNKPQWVILSSRRRHGQPAWIYNDMHYIYALTTRSRSVWSGIGGPGGCVIVLPNRNYKWTTADCASHHCFVCENRNIYVWTEHDLALLVMDGAGENTSKLTEHGTRMDDCTLYYNQKLKSNKQSDKYCLQCFDAVGWTAGRVSGL